MTDSAEVPLLTIERRGSTSLFSLLEGRDEETFCQLCVKKRDRLDEDNGKYTYLQLACLYGLHKAVEALLMNGADPNLVCHPDQYSPIMIAGQQGYLNIVEMLAKHNRVNLQSTVKGTVLHAVLEGMSKDRDQGDLGSIMEKYVNCLKFLLEEHSSNSLDINAQNKDGFTALHLAVKLHEKSIILLLLEHGAYIGAKCRGGYKIISLLDADGFEEYLNDCIDTNGKLPIDKDYQIIYDYRFLDPLRIYRNKQKVGEGNPTLVSETEPLIELSGVPELRHLTKHPVLTSFLNMKWLTIREYYWVNLTFYLTFWFCLTLHTIAVYSPDKIGLNERRRGPVAFYSWYPSVFLCSLLGLREFFKLGVLSTRYLFDVENLLDVALLTSNVLVLSGKVQAGVGAIALLLTWTEMVLLINRHPSLASNIVMYKLVCTNFVKLFAWWSMLIVAFALSFYLLFKDADEPICMQKSNETRGNNNDVSKFFEDTRMSFFKVLLMMTGEFETSSIPFECHPGISHVVFILFVFLVTIVLLNLINGLAVSDTLAIRSDAEIVGYSSLAKQIAYIEKMINHLRIFDSLLYCVTSNPVEKGRLSTSVFYKQVNLFPNVLPDSCVHVLPNQSNKVIFCNHVGRQYGPGRWNAKIFRLIPFYNLYTRWCIVSEITNESKKILQTRKNKREENERSSNSPNTHSEKLKTVLEKFKRHSAKLEKCSEKLDKYWEKLEDYGRRITQLEETTNRKMNRVLELLGDYESSHS